MPKPSAFMDFEIVGNDVGVQQMLNRIDSAFGVVGMTSFMQLDVHPYLVERAENRFSNEGDDVSGKWAPLAEATIEIREHLGYGAGPINRRTGELEAYITQSQVDIVSAPGSSILRFPRESSSADKSIRKKMSTAQRGRAQPKTVPRPVIGLNEQDLGAIMTALAFHVKRWTL